MTDIFKPMRDLTFNPELRAHIESLLVNQTGDSNHKKSQHSNPQTDTHKDPLKEAAVAVVLVPDGQDQACLLLTRRASGLRRHGGQFALPGGRVDPGETNLQAALREVHEEVGLELQEDDLLGSLDNFVTRSGFVMFPFVFWGHGGDLIANPGEVEQIYRLPLWDCSRPEALVETDFLAGPDSVPALDLDTIRTWVFAPTAAVIHQFAELAVHGRRTSVAHFDQPQFAWK